MVITNALSMNSGRLEDAGRRVGRAANRRPSPDGTASERLRRGGLAALDAGLDPGGVVGSVVGFMAGRA